MVVAHMADLLAVMPPPASAVVASAIVVSTVIMAAAVMVPVRLRDAGPGQAQRNGGQGDSDQSAHGLRLS